MKSTARRSVKTSRNYFSPSTNKNKETSFRCLKDRVNYQCIYDHSGFRSSTTYNKCAAITDKYFCGCTSKLFSLFAAVVIVVSILFLGGCASSAENIVSDASQSEGNAATQQSGDSTIKQNKEEEVNESTGSSTDFESKGELKVRFIDVGQGDCALVSFGEHHMLIDGGKPKASSTVYTILERLGISEIERIVASHPDADHCGGLAGALEIAKCDNFYCSTTESNTRTFDNIKEQVSRQGIGITVPKVGDNFKLGEATVTFIGPTSKFESDNNNSLILRIDYGNKSFLFTGDMEHESEASIIQSGENIKADVLKVSHHGSRTASGSRFLSKARPEYAVISCGKNNDYRHPHKQTLNHLQKVGAKVLRTDKLGDIVFTTEGNTLTVRTTKEGIED